LTSDKETLRLEKHALKEKRLSDLYRKNPELKRLDDSLAAAGREALIKAWDGENVRTAGKQIVRIQAQRERLLNNLGLDESIYDIPWDCALCQDKGYLRPGEPCECLRRDAGDRLRALSGLSTVQLKMSFDNFSLDWYDRPAEAGRLAEQIRRFCDHLIAGEACGNLFLFGPVGNGKTHLSSAAANRVLAAGKSVVYTRTEELLEALREDFYHRGDSARGDVLGKLLDADLLILEDLGTERLTDFAEEQSTALIDQRIHRQKPWIITSHLIGEKFTVRYDQRLVDRVLGEGTPLFLNEKSIRFKKAQLDRT